MVNPITDHMDLLKWIAAAVPTSGKMEIYDVLVDDLTTQQCLETARALGLVEVYSQNDMLGDMTCIELTARGRDAIGFKIQPTLLRRLWSAVLPAKP